MTASLKPEKRHHTLGPWRWETCIGDNGGEFRRLVGADYQPVIDGEYGAFCEDVDAALIAAAPDQHAAAVEIDRLALVIESAVRNGENTPNYRAVLAALQANRDAIKRAEGR